MKQMISFLTNVLCCIYVHISVSNLTPVSTNKNTWINPSWISRTYRCGAVVTVQSFILHYWFSSFKVMVQHQCILWWRPQLVIPERGVNSVFNLLLTVCSQIQSVHVFVPPDFQSFYNILKNCRGHHGERSVFSDRTEESSAVQYFQVRETHTHRTGQKINGSTFIRCWSHLYLALRWAEWNKVQ